MRTKNSKRVNIITGLIGVSMFVIFVIGLVHASIVVDLNFGIDLAGWCTADGRAVRQGACIVEPFGKLPMPSSHSAVYPWVCSK